MFQRRRGKNRISRAISHFGFEPWDRVIRHRAVVWIVTDRRLKDGLEQRKAASASSSEVIGHQKRRAKWTKQRRRKSLKT